MKKAIKVVGIILSVLVLLVAILLVGVRIYFKGSVSSYYKEADKAFVIPGLNSGFIPQGIHYDEAGNQIYMTGYSKDNSSSPLYVIDREAPRSPKRIELLLEDGSVYNGHASGVAAYGDYLYVAGYDDYLYVYDREAAANASDGDGLQAKGQILVGENDGITINAGTVTVNGDQLMVADFYRPESHETPDTHTVDTENGVNRALAVIYSFDPSAELGLDLTPVCVYSLPDLVQGLAWDGNDLYLSTSYGLAFSAISKYDSSKFTESTFDFNGQEVPLYIVNESSCTGTIKTPPMSEEIEIIDGKLYTACESASNKYIFGKFTSGKYCYALPLESVR
ncbi:MAG: hypothetical protein KBS83_03780 [Lachnospiraceae bacterium]|nr:hypothetical protein [Candidatus Equihabitans merdae]